MADDFLTPDHCRAQARHHREEAMKLTDGPERMVRLAAADEYEKLAAAIEAEAGVRTTRAVQ